MATTVKEYFKNKAEYEREKGLNREAKSLYNRITDRIQALLEHPEEIPRVRTELEEAQEELEKVEQEDKRSVEYVAHHGMYVRNFNMNWDDYIREQDYIDKVLQNICMEIY